MISDEEIFERVVERYTVEDLITELNMEHLYDEDELLDLDIETFVQENRRVIRANRHKLDIY